MVPGWMLRPRCWIRGSHRWRVPTLALLAECRDLPVRVRCADCGFRRSVSGRDVQRHRHPGLGAAPGSVGGGAP
jgi:hypothetical protein